MSDKTNSKLGSNIITRFAPSPTGYLHVGNVRTALVNWLFAKKYGGKFILRIDDTDVVRSKKEYEDAIKEDFIWLDMRWDITVNQKDRLDRYESVKNQLISMGRLYPCYETQEELELKRKIQLSQSKPPIYDRHSLHLTDKQVNAYKAEGRTPHYRFKLSDETIEWDDMIRGSVKFESNIASDPILIRGDGSWTYMLCSVVDDIDMSVSHIMRGDDHVNNTAIHVQMFEALGAKTIPVFGHLPRIITKAAELSKRTGGFSIRDLRDNHSIEHMTINNFLAAIGTSNPPSEFTEIMDLTKEFDVSKYHKSPTTYEEHELLKLNHKIIANLSFEIVNNKLIKMGVEPITEDFWVAIKNNLDKLSDVKIWRDICSNSMMPEVSEDDTEFLQVCASLFPVVGSITEETWKIWIDDIKSNTNRKGKQIFMPLRLALTGIDHGPELKHLLPLLGREKIMARLSASLSE